jgi:hypothetical protein
MLVNQSVTYAGELDRALPQAVINQAFSLNTTTFAEILLPLRKASY